MSSADKIIEGFPHPTVTPIVGQPAFDTLKALKLLLSTNAASVISHLGNGALGLLWLVVSDAVYNTLSGTPFVPPTNPGPIPVIPANATGPQINAIHETHKREAKLFHEYNNTDKALKQLLLGAVDDMFTRAIKNRYIGYANVTTKQLLTHLITTYGKISGNDLRLNDAAMNTAYDVNLPIEVLFDQIEDGLDFADAGNHPKTPEQIVMTGQQLIQETGMFADDLKVWKRLPDQDRTWTRFKADFTLAHQELRENVTVGQRHFNQANNVGQDDDIVDAMANLATATAADRSAVAALTDTVSNLTTQLAEAHTQLAKVNAQLVTAQRNANTGGRARGRGGGRTTTATASRDEAFQARVGGPSGRHYCWSCGACCYHASPKCRSKKPGHKDDATVDNKMNGSTHSFA